MKNKPIHPLYPVGEVLVFRSSVHQRSFAHQLALLVARTGPLNGHLVLNVAARSVVDTETFAPFGSSTNSIRQVSVMHPITAYQRRRVS